MNAPISPVDRLQAELQQFARSEGLKACFCVRAVTSHQIKSMEMDAPVLILPLVGRKRLADAGTEVYGMAGDLMLVPGARVLDVENIPDPQAGEYVAVAVAVCAEVLDAARRLWNRPLPAQPGPITVLRSDAYVEPLRRWIEALSAGPELAARHALLGVVLALCEQGHADLLVPVDLRWSARIHRMVGADPARDWTSADVEQTLAVSGATLRRRLAEEDTTLREVLMQARLACALQLLYSTRLPVKTVAQRVGYASVSTFVKRFGERYGMEPSRIGNAPPG